LTDPKLFALCGVILFGLGFEGLVVARHLLRRIIALNLMSAGVFLVLVTLAPVGDPVPHAMVLTGIVVSISATALGLALVRRLQAETGRAELPDPPQDPS
jgi:multicomponent Na+:H+ antiporter subunit C